MASDVANYEFGIAIYSIFPGLSNDGSTFQ